MVRGYEIWSQHVAERVFLRHGAQVSYRGSGGVVLGRRRFCQYSRIGSSEFEEFHTYRLEWTPRQRLAWYKDGEFLYEITQDSLTNLTRGLQIPDEPTYLLLNTAMSSTWGFPAPCPAGCACDCFDCKKEACKCAIAEGFCDSLPAHFLIDYVRLYQNEKHSVGCDPPSHPQPKFIQAHLDRYLDPDAPRKDDAASGARATQRGGGRVFMGGSAVSVGIVCDGGVGVVSHVPARVPGAAGF